MTTGTSSRVSIIKVAVALILCAFPVVTGLSITSSISMISSSPKSSILYDLPVSNNGARCRLILYKKGITDVKIVSPMELGGLKSEEYLGMNPQGKMPLLSINDGNNIMNIPESDTICRYLLSTYNNIGPDFLINDTTSNLITRIHDMYITTIQGCLYKANPPFGIYGTRSDAIQELLKQLQIIENLISSTPSDYLCGDSISLADASLYPTMIFIETMLPKFGITDGIPPKLTKWFQTVRAKDPTFAKIYDEVRGGIAAWESNGRWDTIHMAGLRDSDDPSTIFTKIINREIPSDIVYEDEKVFAFKDINPAAPAHILVIPKDRMNLTNLRRSSAEHIEILGRLLVAAGEVAKNQDLGFIDGARIIINDGTDAGQEIPYLHLHVLGGRTLSWPPG